jgi:hypothetical protein
MPRYTTRILVSLLAGASVIVAATMTLGQPGLMRPVAFEDGGTVVVRTSA